MRNDQIFVLMLVVLLPMSGCFDGGGVGEAEGAQDSSDSDSENSENPYLSTFYSTIIPVNLHCSYHNICVWEHAMTINTSSTEAVEIISYSSTTTGSYYEPYDNSTRVKITTGAPYAVSSCNSGQTWNNSLQLSENSLLNAYLPTVGDTCQHDIFIQDVHTGNSQSDVNISEIQFSLTWTVHSVSLV